MTLARLIGDARPRGEEETWSRHHWVSWPSVSSPWLARHTAVERHAPSSGQQHVLRQTMIALAGGHELAEHDSPREATLQVLVGKVRLSSAIDAWEGVAGGFVAIPVERHSLLAIDDSVVLLTAITEG